MQPNAIHNQNQNPIKKIGVAVGLVGLLILALALFNAPLPYATFMLPAALVFIVAGTAVYAGAAYLTKPEGIFWNNTWFKSISSRGWLGWILGFALTAFYVVIYWFPQYLGYNDKGTSTGLVAFFNPLSFLLNGKPATQWFVYGSLYTVAIFAFGIKFIFKYRHNRYQIIRTCSIMFFQLGFAFLIPELLQKLNPSMPYFGKDLKNMWPLQYDFFYDYNIKNMLGSGSIGKFFLFFGLAMIFIISPILTYFFGKRWYCSWVCGCGGLAETAGDPFRHLSDKSEAAWKFERVSIHAVLVFVFVTTLAVIYSYLGTDRSEFLITKNTFAYGMAAFIAVICLLIFLFKRKALDKDAVYTMVALSIVMVACIFLNHLSGNGKLFFLDANQFKQWYGFAIGAIFSGVIGVGFYPIMGSRVWCRFGCPMAAILGLQQRLFSRFRITTNGGQCISCGNCSNACEMGIDVREYAQRGENIVRSSCVGCGICSAVCPRGVLKLENGKQEGRINQQTIPLGNDFSLQNLLKG